MKNFLPVAAMLLAGAILGGVVRCKPAKEVCEVYDYTIINRIESDIVVELKFGDRQITTIKSGETQMLYSEVRCYKPGGPVPDMPAELMNAEMRIDGEVIPRYIWWREYWIVDTSIENHFPYTLTVTEELLDTIKNFGTE
jgi:hypothetical protein